MYKQIPRLITPLTKISHYTTSTSTFKSRIYDSIRNEGDFHTALRLTTTSGLPLITLWTTSYCPSCRVVKPLLEDVVEHSGGVGFAEVELDAPGMGELGYRYSVTALPSVLVFVRGEVEERLVDARVMRDRARLETWVGGVAERGGGAGGAGGKWFGGLFGG